MASCAVFALEALCELVAAAAVEVEATEVVEDEDAVVANGLSNSKPASSHGGKAVTTPF